MNSVQDIRSAISRLSTEELVRFREWFDEFEAHAWDKQIDSDAKSERLDMLAKEAIDEYGTGKRKEL